MASDPPPGVGQIQAFANECIEQAGESVDKAVKEDLLKRIKELGVAEGVKEVGVLSEGNVLIEGDVREWKRSLKKTEPARPIYHLLLQGCGRGEGEGEGRTRSERRGCGRGRRDEFGTV